MSLHAALSLRVRQRRMTALGPERLDWPQAQIIPMSQGTNEAELELSPLSSARSQPRRLTTMFV